MKRSPAELEELVKRLTAERVQLMRKLEAANVHIEQEMKTIEEQHPLIANLKLEIKQLTICQCGRKLSKPLCKICDNDL